LQRTDIFPIGDLALVKAIRMAKSPALSREDILAMSENWHPYRSLATLIFWHFYVRKKNIKILH
jgi:DNA-3-methyladenine glycosylase II